MSWELPVSRVAADLLSNLLCLSSKRYTIDQFMAHPFMKTFSLHKVDAKQFQPIESSSTTTPPDLSLFSSSSSSSAPSFSSSSST